MKGVSQLLKKWDKTGMAQGKSPLAVLEEMEELEDRRRRMLELSVDLEDAYRRICKGSEDGPHY